MKMFILNVVIFNRAKTAKWNVPDLPVAYNRVYKAGSKIGVHYNEDLYYNILRHNVKKAELPERLKDRYMLENRALMLEPSNFFFDIFDRKLQEYIEADLINYNVKKERELDNPKKFQKFVEPFAVLTLGELEAGFVMSLLPLAFSCLVFGIEWVLTFKDLIVFLFIFKKYFEMKQSEQKSHNKTIKTALVFKRIKKIRKS